MSLTPQVKDIVLSIMEGLSCARSLQVAILVRYGEWDQLTTLSCDPALYSDPSDYLDAVTATDLLRKYDGFELFNSDGTPLDLEGDAIKKWRWSETECFHTNRRLGTYLLGGAVNSDFTGHVRIAEFLRDMKRYAYQLIGSGPEDALNGRFGPGATVSDRSSATSVPDKMSSVPTITPSAWPYVVPWMETAWGRAAKALGRSIDCSEGNEFFTVPKDSRKLRGCAKSPSINVFYQLALGKQMRRRLKRQGIDLDLGQDIHKQVACAASKSGEFCTIDLTEASNCVSTSLVELVLPPRWHNAMNMLRESKTGFKTPTGLRWHVLEKFSAMGNGFTFELETTVFATIALACMGGTGIPGVNMWVYGDDIIVPTEFGPAVINALKYFGFTPNPKKTFLEGAFRESCGGDFLDGEAVRPFHLESDPDEPTKLISLANALRRNVFSNTNPVQRWSRLQKAWFRILDNIPSSIRGCRGPEALGDIVLHDSESRWQVRWRSSIRYVRVYRPARFVKIRWEGFAYDVQMAAALYGVVLNKESGPRDPASLRDRWLVGRDSVQGYKVGWTSYS